MRYRIQGIGSQIDGIPLGETDSAADALDRFLSTKRQLGDAQVFDQELGGEVSEQELRRRADAEREAGRGRRP